MNVFQKLAKNLIDNKTWKSSIELIQLEQEKNGNKLVNRISFSRVIPCVIKNVEQQDNNGIYTTYLEFTVSSEDLKEFNLSEKLIQVEFNGKANQVEKINPMGIIGNEPTVYSLLIRG